MIDDIDDCFNSLSFGHHRCMLFHLFKFFLDWCHVGSKMIVIFTGYFSHKLFFDAVEMPIYFLDGFFPIFIKKFTIILEVRIRCVSITLISYLKTTKLLSYYCRPEIDVLICSDIISSTSGKGTMWWVVSRFWWRCIWMHFGHRGNAH